jgi:hypothetical protein
MHGISQVGLHSRLRSPKERTTVNNAIPAPIVENRLPLSAQPEMNVLARIGGDGTQELCWSRIAKSIAALGLVMAIAWVGIAVHTQYLETETERLIAASHDLRL